MKKNGGPAFPVSWDMKDPLSGEYSRVAEPGMTIRQAYKMAALQGLLPSSLLNIDSANTGTAQAKLIAKFCSVIADAMLDEDAENDAKVEVSK